VEKAKGVGTGREQTRLLTPHRRKKFRIGCENRRREGRLSLVFLSRGGSGARGAPTNNIVRKSKTAKRGKSTVQKVGKKRLFAMAL